MKPDSTRVACAFVAAGLMLSTTPGAGAAVPEWDAPAIALHRIARALTAGTGEFQQEHAGDLGPGSWPNIHVEDAYTRGAATRALDGAARWLAQAKCQTLFGEFKNDRNLPLTATLRALDTNPEGYLRMVVFMDGALFAACKRHGVLAFTARGSRVVYLCGRDFERAWRKDVAEVQAVVIHELLHSLGLGENPPSPGAITHRVRQLCW